MSRFFHNCAIEWLSDSKTDWVSSGPLNTTEMRLVQVQGNTSTLFQSAFLITLLRSVALEITEGPYRGTRKEPDALFHVPHQTHPTLVVDVGWSESYEDLLDGMNRLLIGSDGKINVAFIVKFTRHLELPVSGIVKLYRLDPQGYPRLEQNEVLFPMPAGDPPQLLTGRLGELCAGTGPGRDIDALFPLSVGELRFHAATCLAKESYFPA